MRHRIVFDTGVVVSVLLFPRGRLTWLRAYWGSGKCVPLISTATVKELVRVLGYPKFRMVAEDRLELLGEYLPFCETVVLERTCPIVCHDRADQIFLDLAESGNADVLVSGDADLLALAGLTRFTVLTAEQYRASTVFR